jgi:hypothetical protein
MECKQCPDSAPVPMPRRRAGKACWSRGARGDVGCGARIGVRGVWWQWWWRAGGRGGVWRRRRGDVARVRAASQGAIGGSH